MLEFLWLFINVGFFIYALKLAISVTRYLRDNHSFPAALIFVIGLLSFVGKSSKTNKDKINKSERQWVFKQPNELEASHSGYAIVEFDKNWLSSCQISVGFGKEKSTGNTVAESASGDLNGLVAGRIWDIEMITVNETSTPGEWEYTINGTIEWNLLGLRVFSNSKTWTGKVYNANSHANSR